MEEKKFDLEEYLTAGAENIVKNAMRAALGNPRESAFLAQYALAAGKAAKRRRQEEKRGGHVPPFLIASITSSCNLHCRGCYARANGACGDGEEGRQLGDEAWQKIFCEAREMGVGFILLAGGEPLLRRGVIERAGKIKEIIFPIFTNGTMIDGAYEELFDANRNLLPILSMEGTAKRTDDRRGEGVYRLLGEAMERFRKRCMLFGASITVTAENLKEVTAPEYLEKLRASGCRVVIYVEYVPVENGSDGMALDDCERVQLSGKIAHARERFPDMVLISFPGDEKSSGGCLAAGRGFFHINAGGGAEPCPFAPYSDINVRDTSLREAMTSVLFRRLKENGVLMEEHDGGCVLFQKRAEVERLISGQP